MFFFLLFFPLKSLLWDVRSCCVPRCECTSSDHWLQQMRSFSPSGIAYTTAHSSACSHNTFCLHWYLHWMYLSIIFLQMIKFHFYGDFVMYRMYVFRLLKNHFFCHNLLLYRFCCCEPASCYVTLAGLELTVYHRLVRKSLPFCLGPLSTISFILCAMQLLI